MKIVLFGTGDYYNKYKKWFVPDDIVALLDNNSDKAGLTLDGHPVLLPEKITDLYYDYIVILSVHEKEMRKQLIDLGVEDDKIIASTQLFRHPEITRTQIEAQLFLPDNISREDFDSVSKCDIILLMSYDLNLNGASLALYYAAICLNEAGYQVIVASWDDGQLRGMLNNKGIAVIVDQNLELRTEKQITWVRGYKKVLCNTLMYYNFLSDRDMDEKYIWWLHDPEIFYENLDKKILESISLKNLYVYAAGRIAASAAEKYIPGVEAKLLLCGIPDTEVHKLKSQQIEMAVIANVQEYKGQDILIDALKELSTDELQQLHVRIIGNLDSVYAKNLMIRSESLGNTVDFISTLSRKEINKVYDSLDVLVVPSRVDTMSLTAVEAMQHYVTPLVSSTTGIAYYIDSGYNGIIFHSKNIDDCVDKLRWCISHRDRLSSIGDNARKVYDKYFSMDVFNSNLLNVVRNIFGY